MVILNNDNNEKNSVFNKYGPDDKTLKAMKTKTAK